MDDTIKKTDSKFKRIFKFLFKLLRLTIVPFLIEIGLMFGIMIAAVFLFYQAFFNAVILLAIQNNNIDQGKIMNSVPDMLTGSFLEILTYIIPVLTGIYFFFWYRRLLKKENRPEAKVRLFTIKNIILIALAGLGLQLATSGLMELILPHLPEVSEGYEKVMEVLFKGNPILVFISIVIIAPLSEELTFRGVIFKNARKIMPFAAANIVQALLFGLAHFNIVQGIYAFGGGLVMGFVAYKFKSVKASMMLHFFYNGMSYLLMTPSNQLFMVLFVAAGAVMIIISILQLRKVRPVIENI